MDTTALSALNAYKNQLKMMDGADTSAQDDSSASSSSFSDMLKQGTQDAVNTMYKSEATQMKSLTGKVELTDLATAVTNAEMTLNTVVAIRDRVINAYQDIIKMSI